MQKIFGEFITVEMTFHAKALEVYTTAYQHIQNVDEEGDLEVGNHTLSRTKCIYSIIVCYFHVLHTSVIYLVRKHHHGFTSPAQLWTVGGNQSLQKKPRQSQEQHST